jgi:hypothetical protein
MREFSKIGTGLWSSKVFRKASDDARFVYFYLLTCPHQNSCGCFSLPDGYAITDLGWTIERYIAARDENVKLGLIHLDADTSEILIVKWFQHNAPQNPSHRKAILGAIERIAAVKLRDRAAAELDATMASAKSSAVSSRGTVVPVSAALMAKQRGAQ